MFCICNSLFFSRILLPENIVLASFSEKQRFKDASAHRFILHYIAKENKEMVNASRKRGTIFTIPLNNFGAVKLLEH